MASKTTNIRFLTTKQVTRLHNLSIRHGQPTQPSLLGSALQSPLNIMHYTNEQNVFQLAASLSERIMKNHAFADGNKRTALVAAAMFLKANGYHIRDMRLRSDGKTILSKAQVAVCTNAWTPEDLGRLYQQLNTHDGVDSWKMWKTNLANFGQLG